MVFENTHEPIINLDTWERVQELRKNKRRPIRTGKTNMFSGIVYCADCKQKLYYCTTKYFESRQDHFVCATSRKGKDECSTHFIRALVLETGVLAHLNYVISFVANYENQFREMIGAKHKTDVKKQFAAKRKAITKSENRIKELDRLIKAIYEYKVSGVLSESRFQIFSADLILEIEQQEEQADNLERFIEKVHKYFDLQELTPAVLNDMVKRVEVHAPKEIDGQRTQEVDIYYDLVGYLSLLLLTPNSKTA